MTLDKYSLNDIHLQEVDDHADPVPEVEVLLDIGITTASLRHRDSIQLGVEQGTLQGVDLSVESDEVKVDFVRDTIEQGLQTDLIRGIRVTLCRLEAIRKVSISLINEQLIEQFALIPIFCGKDRV